MMNLIDSEIGGCQVYAPRVYSIMFLAPFSYYYTSFLSEFGIAHLILLLIFSPPVSALSHMKFWWSLLAQ